MYKIKHRLKIVFILVGLILCVKPEAISAKSGGLSLIRDTEIESILREWSAPIFKAAALNPEGIHIILVQSEQVNAFVAGGSNIFIYTGLLQKTKTPGEVIGVIAHETGHIAGGHLIKTREALERASYESIIGTILGIGAALVAGDASAAPAVAAGGSSIAQRRFLAHSRVHESAADQAALTFLEKAKINPKGLASFMDTLKSQAFIPQSQQSEYVRTHPIVDNRIEALMRRIESSAYKVQPYPEKWVEQHARLKAKLIGFINPAQIPWVYDDSDLSTAAQYARAIGAYRDNHIDDALARIDGLLKKEPKNPYFLELKGQMLVDFGRMEQAIPYYRQASDILPTAPLLRIALAHALIETGKDANLNEAIKELERALRSEPRAAQIHRLLATAYGRLKQHNLAKIHLAEEAVLQRRFSYARQHAQTVLANEKPDTRLWVKAKDIISFLEIVEK